MAAGHLCQVVLRRPLLPEHPLQLDVRLAEDAPQLLEGEDRLGVLVVAELLGVVLAQALRLPDAQVALEDLHLGQPGRQRVGDGQELERTQRLVELLVLHVDPRGLEHGLGEQVGVTRDLEVAVDRLGRLIPFVVNPAERHVRQLDDALLVLAAGRLANQLLVLDHRLGQVLLGDVAGAQEVPGLEVVTRLLLHLLELSDRLVQLVVVEEVLAAHVGHRGAPRRGRHRVEQREPLVDVLGVVELESELDEPLEALLVELALRAALLHQLDEEVPRRDEVALHEQRLGQVVERLVVDGVLRILLDHVVEDDRGVVVVADAEVDLGVDRAPRRHVSPARAAHSELARPADAGDDRLGLALVLDQLVADLADRVGLRDADRRRAERGHQQQPCHSPGMQHGATPS